MAEDLDFEVDLINQLAASWLSGSSFTGNPLDGVTDYSVAATVQATPRWDSRAAHHGGQRLLAAAAVVSGKGQPAGVQMWIALAADVADRRSGPVESGR